MTDQEVTGPPWVDGETVGSALRATARKYPGQDAVVFPRLGLRWSWGEFDRRIDVAAAALGRLGLAPGAHIGIWSMNAPEWLITQFAAARAGAVLVNINPAYRLHELDETLRAADVDTLVVGAPFKGSNFVQMVEDVCPEVATAASVDWISDRLPTLRRLVAIGDRPGAGWLSWSELEREEGGDREEVARREGRVSATDVYNIQFTSGTTGMPKGAMLTHRNVLMNAFYIGERLRYDERDRVCIPVPFYHCFGCVLGTMVCAVYGSAIVAPSANFDAGATIAALSSERCTSLYGVPTMFIAELGHPDVARADLTSLRTGIMSGSPCPLPVMEQVLTTLGARQIAIGYGQTEASPIITLTSVDDPVEVRCGTVGRPIPGVEVKLIDRTTGREVGDDEPGELHTRGHHVMAGYYKNPEATARVIDPDGWLATGDLARRRPDGNYRIVGRCKELIIRGGENIYPPEVEEFLHRHPCVSEVAVVGLPDAKYGEALAAWVVTKPGRAVTFEEVREFCVGQIAHFKVPQYVLFVDHLPKTVTGKIRKHILREQGIAALGLEAVAAIQTA